MNRDRIRCYKCREYGHFAKDCPTSKVEKESGQIQQMYHMDEEQTALQLINDRCLCQPQLNKFNRRNTNGPFKLIKGEKGPATFLPLHTKFDGQARYIKERPDICLMEDQAKYIYKR